MQRLQALLLSRTAKATSAACFICGCAWLYAKRRHPGQPELALGTIVQWLPASRWLWKANHNDWQLIGHLEATLRNVTPKEAPGATCSERSRLSVTKYITEALQHFVLLTKDPALCDLLLSSPALSGLVRLTAEQGDQFDHCVLRQIAELFANLSPRPAAASVFSRNGLDPIISSWLLRKDCAHLSLCAAKLRDNLETAGRFMGSLYPLTSRSRPPHPLELDVVFVNGINGSVFHTWRQRDEVAEVDEKYTKCWPRDWLSEDFPSARILGADVKIRAWSWNPATSDRDSERTLSARSARLRQELEAAEVGNGGRRVVWVAHSMGGLLVKELLRQDSRLCGVTRGVLFLSTPHRGCRSLRVLFHFPLRLALSRESREVGQDCAALRELDTWFRATERQLGWRVLNCAEDRATAVNALCSVRLVELPGEDPTHEITIPTDHIDVSKPRDRNDLIYSTVKSFLSDCLS